MIVDSELGNLAAYNARKEPLLEDFYLPARIALLYASGELQSDSLMNKLVALCDRNSSEILNHIVETGDRENLFTASGMPFTQYRKWKKEQDG